MKKDNQIIGGQTQDSLILRELNQREEPIWVSQKHLTAQKRLKLSTKVGNSKALSANKEAGIIHVLQHYAYALEILDKEATRLIHEWHSIENHSPLFSSQRDGSVKSSMETIYQNLNCQNCKALKPDDY